MVDNEQILTSYDRLDKVRTECDGKVNELRKELDKKIEGKMSGETFQWIIGTIVVIMIAVMGSGFAHVTTSMSAIADKVDTLNNRTTILETKLSERKK